MKYKTTAVLNVRSEPKISPTNIVAQIPIATMVDASDTMNSMWKFVTLQDGRTGYCASTYLEKIQGAEAWHAPVPLQRFKPTQPYLNEDWTLYPQFGHHTGVDYGGAGQTGIPLFACADGEMVYRDIASSPWGTFLGNHAALFIPSVNKSFLYCHMAAEPHALGMVTSGDQIGIMGNTGKSAAGAIHLHLEGFYGRFKIAWRTFISLDDIKKKTFDADQCVRMNL